LAEYSAATGQDQNSILVDYDVFMNVPMLNAQDPVSRTTVYPLEGLGLQAAPGSAAIDRGMVIPNVTDDYTGAAPISAHWSSASRYRCTDQDTRRTGSKSDSPRSRRDGLPSSPCHPALFFDQALFPISV
jgi:hypothetical protein